jgi:hypothetical protein
VNRLDALLAWYGTLEERSLARIGEFYHPQARFDDPFNSVVGLDGIGRVFAHMFRATETPRFTIAEHLADADRAFVTWDFDFGIDGRRYRVHGVTRLRFDAGGLVTEHRDYWDAAGELWVKLPLIGGPVRWLRRRFRAT